MDNFTTMEYLLSFPGMIAAVIILTQFFKGMFDKITSHETKYVVYMFAAILCVTAAIFKGEFVTVKQIMSTSLVWLVNSVIVWFAAMKAFETVSRKTDGVLRVDQTNPDKKQWSFDFGENLPNIHTKKKLVLKVDNKYKTTDSFGDTE